MLFQPFPLHRAQVDSFNPYEGTDNVYEDVTTSASKKKKTDVKKRKGPPKSKTRILTKRKNIKAP